jgi:hypothetical protein
MTDIDLYREHGYVHARGVFDAQQVDEMRAAIEGILAGVAGTEHDANHLWKAVAQEARDPEDPPVLRDGLENHVNRGQGLMVAGPNPVYRRRRTRFDVSR